MGGNDVGFGSILTDCFLHADAAVRAQAADLPDYYRRIATAAPNGRVVVGYPQTFPRTQAEAVNCGWLTRGERQALNSLGSDLNEIERQAAVSAGVSFVSVANALAGHELCTRDSWMSQLSVTCKFDSKCGHPLAAGQNAIADLVRRALGI